MSKPAFLDFDPRALVASLSAKGILPPPPPVLEATPSTQTPVTIANSKRRSSKLPRHYTRSTLPNWGATRPDGFRFVSGLKDMDKEGREFWRECWLSPQKWDHYKNKRTGKGPFKKHTIHFHKPNDLKRGQRNAQSMIFVKYDTAFHRDGTQVWYEKWACPKTKTGKQILKKYPR
jgi:hypothetical protein